MYVFFKTTLLHLPRDFADASEALLSFTAQRICTWRMDIFCSDPALHSMGIAQLSTDTLADVLQRKLLQLVGPLFTRLH